MKFNSFLLCTLLSFGAIAQNATKTSTNSKPKLVVGIMVDQMRWDYINKFKAYFGSNGFLRLVNEGSTCDFTMIPYVPTVTAVGHASVYTGSVPAMNGITGNNWFDNYAQKSVYCVEDNSVNSVGIENSAAGKMSPANLWTTTIGDLVTANSAIGSIPLLGLAVIQAKMGGKMG